MTWNLVLIGTAVALVGAVNITYQIYKMTVLDALSRGFKHPKLLGFMTSGGQNCSGIMLYLIGRRKYPSTISETGREEIESRKKKVGMGLVFVTIGAIVMVIGFFSV